MTVTPQIFWWCRGNDSYTTDCGGTGGAVGMAVTPQTVVVPVVPWEWQLHHRLWWWRWCRGNDRCTTDYGGAAGNTPAGRATGAGKREELSPLCGWRVVRTAVGLWMTAAKSSLNSMSFFHLVDDFGF